MKNRSVISLFALILVIFGLFAACAGASDSDSKPDPKPDPNSTYTVKFEANGGDPVPDSQNIVHGEKVVPPPAMAKTGCGFGGWYKERACTNEWNFATDTVTGNITLYAQWDVNYHTVDFNANDGSPAPNQQTIAYGAKVVQPPAMTKTGYGFGGWYKEEGCINQWNFTSDTVNDDITLYAKWDMNYYTVSFNTNGGSPVPDSQSITHHGMVVQPPVMVKTGYGFGGWYKEATCTNEWDFATDTVTGNITLYAKWNINYYTVSFNANGGSPVPYSQNIAHGEKVVTPPAMTKTGYSFGGWYEEADCINQWNFASNIVSDNMTLYAKWGPLILVSGNTLAAKLQWLSTNAASNSNYILEVTADEDLAPQNLSYSGKNNITIYLKGIESIKVITLSDYDSLFSIGNGITLILDENITLLGISNNASLVTVNSGGTLIMNQGGRITDNLFGGGVYVNGGTFTMNGGKITGNTSISSSGGVHVYRGTFTMSGGEISGNTSYTTSGGGVYVGDGFFTMSGGEISGNTSTSTSTSSVSAGGGVSVGGGTFTMSGGEISGNISTSSSSCGGGVSVGGGTFTMSGGEISGNISTSSSSCGGGVYVGRGTFTMSGGEISGNTSSMGGGVCVLDGRFDMSGGEISGNTSTSTSSSFGGGVYVLDGRFTMSGGEISGNTSTSTSSVSAGGGVSVGGGTFTMRGGEISGNTSTSNTSTSSWGGGVYVGSGMFDMRGGEISGNTSSMGGGVYVLDGRFDMSGGEISGNTSTSSSSYSSYGGGVYVDSGYSPFFKKTGGTIYGYTAGESKSNVIKNNSGFVIEGNGYAVYVGGGYTKRKETTAGAEDNLSYIRMGNFPTWDGAWDY